MSSLRFIQDRSDKRGEQEIETQQRADDAKFVRALALAFERGEFPGQAMHFPTDSDALSRDAA